MNHLVCFVLFLFFFFSPRSRQARLRRAVVYVYLQGGRQNKALRFQISPQLFGGNEVAEGKFLQSIFRLQ